MRNLVRLMFGNPASAVYLGVVGVAVVFAVVAPLFGGNGDASMAWVWPGLFTLPAFSLFLTLGGVAGADASAAFFVVGIVVSALVQSLALGAFLEMLRGRRRRIAGPEAG
jgi:hypothetical protein